MKRPIFSITIAYINGIIIGVYLHQSIPFVVFVICINLLLHINHKFKDYLKLNKKMIIIYFIVFVISIIYTYNKNNDYDNKYINSDGQTLTISGTIVSSIEDNDYKLTYTLKVNDINGNKKYNGDLLLVNILKSNYSNNLKYGEKVQISGKYEEPSKARNYKGFDYKNYLKTKKIYGIITQDNSSIKIIKKRNVNIVNLVNYIFLEKLKTNFLKVLPDRTANLEIGILLGYSNNIDDDIKDAFKDSNLTHMLAVSGENTVYIIMVVTFLFNKKIFGIRNQKIITIAIVVIFVKITGETLSVVRAGITCIIYILASLLYRKPDVKNTISIAVLITIIENPFNLFNVGMQLSYAGTISIILFYNVLNQKIKTKNIVLKYIFESIILTTSANIFIIPIMMYQFNTISFTFILSNLCAQPLVGIATILGFIVLIISMISIEFAKILSMLLNIILLVIIKVAEIFSKMPLSKITVITPNISFIIVFYIILYLLIRYKSCLKEKLAKYKKYLIRILIIIMIIVLICNLIIIVPIKNNLTIHFIDVGQGDSTLIITPSNKKILIDGGGSTQSNSFDVGENTLLPYLLDRKVAKIDFIMVSHFDSDHCQGLEAVIENIKVLNIIVSKQSTITDEYTTIINLCKRKKVKILEVKRGDKIVIDKYTFFNILNPSEDLVTDNKGGLNENAIVAKFSYKTNINYFTMLFTGDIESKTEESLANLYKEGLKSDILKVPHHGSKTSSTIKFLSYIKPEISLIGVGKKNKFGHPNSDVISRITNIGSKIYRTDLCGEITIVVYSNRKIRVNTLIV